MEALLSKYRRIPHDPVNRTKRRRDDTGDDERVFDRLFATPRDTVLQSSEDVYFYIDSMYLRVHSRVLYEVLNIPQPAQEAEAATADTPEIPIDAPTDVLSLLLTCFMADKIPEVGKWSVLKRVILLADMLDCPAALDRLIVSAIEHQTFEDDPLDAFITFAQIDREFAARIALSSMGCRPSSFDIDDITPEIADQIPTPYLLGLVQALHSTPVEFAYGRRPSEWLVVSDNFCKMAYTVNSGREA